MSQKLASRLVAALLWLGTVLVTAPAHALPRHDPVPGGVAVVTLPAGFDWRADAGITLAVNQNMRYDQAVRAMKERAAFLGAYREAFRAMRNAVRDVFFPEGTWRLVRELGVNVHVPTPAEMKEWQIATRRIYARWKVGTHAGLVGKIEQVALARRFDRRGASAATIGPLALTRTEAAAYLRQHLPPNPGPAWTAVLNALTAGSVRAFISASASITPLTCSAIRCVPG